MITQNREHLTVMLLTNGKFQMVICYHVKDVISSSKRRVDYIKYEPFASPRAIFPYYNLNLHFVKLSKNDKRRKIDILVLYTMNFEPLHINKRRNRIIFQNKGTTEQPYN